MRFETDVDHLAERVIKVHLAEIESSSEIWIDTTFHFIISYIKILSNSDRVSRSLARPLSSSTLAKV
jgi:hypothetical protein